MKLRKVDPRRIKVPEIRVTAQFDPELLEQFRESIKEVGQITPPIVYEVEGELVLCDGLHRIREAIDNATPLIDVAILDGDMIDVLTKNIFLDHLRGKTPASEMVIVIKALYQEYKIGIEDIEKRTGLKRSYVEKLIKISEASPVVQEAVNDGRIGLGMAFELSRLPFAIQQEEVMAKTSVLVKPVVKDYKDLVDATLRAIDEVKEQPLAEHKEERPVAIYHCEGCKDEVNPRYLRPVMLCPNCFGDVWKLVKARETDKAEVDDKGGGD